MSVPKCLFHAENHFQEQGKNNTFRAWQHIDGDERGARFGFSLANCGDLNWDNITDLCVGSPYARGGEGQITLFFGDPGGLDAERSQVITAEAIWRGIPFLKVEGLGFVMKEGSNFAGRGSNEILVGAPKSDLAMILSVNADMKLRHKFAFLPPNGNSELEMEHCMSYFGKDIGKGEIETESPLTSIKLYS